MKKEIATLLRRVAQKLDPQKPEVTGYARKVVDFIPYYGLEQYWDLQINGEDEKARIVKMRMRQHAEVSGLICLAENLNSKGCVNLLHNFGTQDRIIDGINCKSGGVTVVVELKGSWS